MNNKEDKDSPKWAKLQEWEEMLQNYSHTSEKTRRMKKLARKFGIPVHLRAKWWCAITGAKDKQQENQGMYQRLWEDAQKCTTSSIHIQQIEKDLERTTIQGVTTNKESLRRVLSAYSILNPSIGYCQSMNFIGSVLLTVVLEEECFWILVTIVEDILPEDYYSATMVGVQSDILVFKNMLSKRFPKISSHFATLQIRLDGVILRWFLCLFVGVLPLEACFHVLDLFLFEGAKALFRVCLALFKINEKNMLATNDFEKIMDILIKMPANVNCAQLIETIQNVECMNTSKIANLRKTTLETLKPENEQNSPPSPSTHTHTSTPPPSSLPKHSPAFSISPPSSPRVRLPSVPPIFSLSQSSLPRFTPKSPETCSPSPNPSPKLSATRCRVSTSTDSYTRPEPLSPSHSPSLSSLSRSPYDSPRVSTPLPTSLSSSAGLPCHTPSPPESPSIPVSPATFSTSPSSMPPISFRCVSPTISGSLSPRSPTSKENFIEKVLAGLPSSTPVQTPPLFRKNSSSSSATSRVPSLFRSPSSPNFSPSSHLSHYRSNPNNINNNNNTTDTTASENQNETQNIDLVRARSEEEVIEIKKQNRRAKIDNFEPIPVLHQYSSSPALTSNNNSTDSTNETAEDQSTTKATKTVEVVGLALASFGISEETEQKSVPWYLQCQVNAPTALDAPKAEQ